MKKETDDIEDLFDDDYPEDLDDLDEDENLDADDTDEFAGSLSDMVSELEAKLSNDGSSKYEDDDDFLNEDADLEDDDDFLEEEPEPVSARKERKPAPRNGADRRQNRSGREESPAASEDRKNRKIKALQDSEVQEDEEVDDYIAARRARQKQKKPRYDMRKVAILAAAVLLFVVLAVAGIRAIIKGRKNNSSSVDTKVQVEADSGTQAETAEPTIAETPLELNAYNEINSLMQSYFKALSDANLSLLTPLVDSAEGLSQASLETRKEYIQSYNNLNLYTHPGLTGDDMIVFASYQMQFRNINTSAPALDYYYVKRNAEGNYVITTTQTDEEKALIDQVQAYQEVQTLSAETTRKMDEAAAADPQLAELIKLLRNSGSSSNSGGDTASSGGETAASVTKTANDSVRVRSSADTSSDDNILGHLEVGDTVTVTGTDGDWSIVEYDGQTGYVKSEFLD